MKRIDSLDISKCFAIFLVLWGHAMTQLMPSHDLDHNIAFVWLYSFHMPLFMLMSGMFAKRAFESAWWQMVIGKCKQLIVSACLFGILWFFLILSDAESIGVKGILVSFIKHEVTCYWFLKSLFLCFLIGWCIYRLKYKWVATIVILLVLLLLHRWQITCFKLGSMLPFFLCGVVLKQYFEYIQKYAGRILVISLFIHSMLVFGCIYDQSIAFNAYFLVGNDYLSAICHYTLYVLTGSAGCMMSLSACILVDQYWQSGRIKNFVLEVGQLTLWIYLTQKILVEILLPRFVQVEMPIWQFDCLFTPCVSIIALVVCAFLSRYLNRLYLHFIL